MKAYRKNPRKISKWQIELLEETLRELGDLSGIVHDLNSDEIVGGNQRSKVFDVNSCETEIAEELAVPDEQGTVAHGYVIWEGKRYAYRQVRWTAEQCARANVVANKVGGEWDLAVLTSEFETQDLLDLGFEAWELGDSEEVDSRDAEEEFFDASQMAGAISAGALKDTFGIFIPFKGEALWLEAMNLLSGSEYTGGARQSFAMLKGEELIQYWRDAFEKENKDGS